MGLLEFVLLILVILALFGGGWGYSRRADWGPYPGGGFGLIVLILVIILLVRLV